MFVSPNEVAKWITTVDGSEIDWDKHIQQCGIDLPFLVAFEHDGDTIRLTNDGVQHGTHVPVARDENGIYTIRPRSSVDFLTGWKIELPTDCYGFLQTRSSLNRNGIFVTSGAYDPEYSGAIGGRLHNSSNGYLEVQQGSRVCQFIVMSGEAAGAYKGQYLNKTERV